MFIHRLRMAGFYVLITVLFAGSSSGQEQPQKEKKLPIEVCTHPWKYAVEPFKIAGNLYYVGNKNVSSHLIDTGKGLILLDTAFSQTAYLLLESIRQLGFDPKDIKYILNTHAHYDHMGGTKALVELTHAKTAMGKADVEMMQRPELTWAPEYGVEFYETFDVDIPLTDGQVISLGNTSIKCVHSPGHTPGCFSFFFDVVEKGRTYRVGIMGGPGLNTLTDKYIQQYNLPQSSRTDYVNTMKRLKQEKVDIVIGAHPSQSSTFEKHAAMTKENNPFIDKNEWGRFIGSLEKGVKSSFGLD